MSFKSIIDSPDYTLDHLIKQALFERAGLDVMYIRKFAKSGVLTANVAEDVWTVGGTRTNIATAETFSLVSSSASDTAAGIGAQVINVFGVDGDFNLVNESVILNGTTPVLTTNEFLNVYRLAVADSGSSETNVGSITISAPAAVSIQGRIEIGRGITQMTHFTVPLGYSALVLDTELNLYRPPLGTSTRSGEFNTNIRVTNEAGSSTNYSAFTRGLQSTGDGHVSISPRIAGVLGQRSTLNIQITSEQNSTIASIQYGLLLIRDNFTSILELIDLPDTGTGKFNVGGGII